MEVDPEEVGGAGLDAVVGVGEDGHVLLHGQRGGAELGAVPELLAEVVEGGAVEDLVVAEGGVGGDVDVGAGAVAPLEAEEGREVGVDDDLVAAHRQLGFGVDEGEDLLEVAAQERHDPLVLEVAAVAEEVGAGGVAGQVRGAVDRPVDGLRHHVVEEVDAALVREVEEVVDEGDAREARESERRKRLGGVGTRKRPSGETVEGAMLPSANGSIQPPPRSELAGWPGFGGAGVREGGREAGRDRRGLEVVADLPGVRRPAARRRGAPGRRARPADSADRRASSW